MEQKYKKNLVEVLKKIRKIQKPLQVFIKNQNRFLKTCRGLKKIRKI